ncbi:glutathione S-transferase family protein [Henriciella aquimarina]|uniref:glutathione S-transferase family protein n=1 Tax=Henriciella aquimarina TaxID=545261 RepID=UPI000A03A49E|nr:glutathione S-transferase family protein [Henriciella aquimarina]
MPLDQSATLELFAFNWVPDMARGMVRDLRPRWAMEEAGLSYRTHLLNAGEARPESYFLKQPFGQVPTLADNGIVVFESGAILLHLAEKSDILMPKTAAGRAATQSWLFAALNSVESFVFELFFINVMYADEEWARLRQPGAEDFMRRRLAPVSGALGDKEYLTGQFTVADIAMATVLRELDRYLPLAEFPNLDAYLKRCLARPAFQRALDAQLADLTAPAPETFPA